MYVSVIYFLPILLHWYRVCSWNECSLGRYNLYSYMLHAHRTHSYRILVYVYNICAIITAVYSNFLAFGNGNRESKVGITNVYAFISYDFTVYTPWSRRINALLYYVTGSELIMKLGCLFMQENIFSIRRELAHTSWKEVKIS